MYYERHSNKDTQPLPEHVQTCQLVSELRCPHELTYNNMTREWKENLTLSYVTFQGKKVTLLSLYGNKSPIYGKLTSQEIKSTLEGNMVIGEKFKPENAYLERSFLRNKNITVTMTEITKELNTSKVFLLADVVGSGKSTTTKMLALHVKDMYPHHYVALIDGKNHQLDVFNSSTTKLLALSIMNLNPMVAKHVSELYDSEQVIFIWDNPELLFKDKNKSITLYKELKSNKIIQLFATTDEHSRYIKEIFGNTSYTFKPLDKEDRANFIRDKFNKENNSHRNITDPVIDHIEAYLNREVITKDFNFISRNNLLIITLMTASAQKLNHGEIFDNFYLIFENHFKIEGLIFNLNLNHEINTLYSIVGEDKLNFGSLHDENARNNLFIAIKNLNYPKFDIHSSLNTFIIFQYIYEGLKIAIESQIKLYLNLLIYFSNFCEDNKLVRNFIAGLKFKNFNPNVKKVLASDYHNVLYKFNSTESPAIFVNFFEHDHEDLNIIGSPQKWLEQKFNISVKDEFLNPENSNTWKRYLDFQQRGKIYFKLWQNRNMPSVNAIQSFTNIEAEGKEFVIDLLSKIDFEHFFDFVKTRKTDKFTREETRELFLSYNDELLMFYENKTKISDKICDYFYANQIFSDEEIKNLSPELACECNDNRKRKRSAE